MLGRDPKEAETVQDGCLEAADLGELRVDVQRVPIAVEAVQGSPLFGRLLLDGSVRVALRRLVGGGGGAAVCAFLRAAETAGATDEEGHFVVEEVAAGFGVGGGGAVDLDGGGAFVDDLD